MLKKIPRAKVDKRDRAVRMTSEAERQKLEKEIDEIKAYLDSVCDYINRQDEAESEYISELSTLVSELTEIIDEIKIDTYSTTETKTNKVWIDGKPIYRKVVELGFIGSNTSLSISGSYENITDFRGFITNLDGTKKKTLDYYTPSLYKNFEAEIDNNSLKINIQRTSTSNWSNWYLTVIIEYTKPTSN